MAEKLTPQQEEAVKNRGGKLLVSAAAGSGKTKVLVDRLLSYLTDPVEPANIDEFLIITYTKAAAAELRTKIANKLGEKILEDPNNRHLQRQMQRLYMTQISTVHSFCTEVLREFSYKLDISGDFRVAEEDECTALQAVVLDQLLDDTYESVMDDSDFRTFLDTQGLGRDDRKVPELIVQVYKSAICHLDPEGWLDWCMSVNDLSKTGDVADTVWGEYLIRDLHDTLDLHIQAMERCVELSSNAENLENVSALLSTNVQQLRNLRACKTWDEIVSENNMKFGTLAFPKKYPDKDLAERIKAVRNACKDAVAKKLKPFSNLSERVLKDMEETAQSARGLITLTRRFMDAYKKAKRVRRMVDFADLEHITLDLLLGKKKTAPTAIAEELSRRYREVMVDEYQDSNEVQDAIFNAITDQRGNCFMVGDVKQSIYRFRLADPGIFLQKYNDYAPADKAVQGQGRKVLLSHNFRSAGAVIDAVNDVFGACMSTTVGGLSYGEDEALREGIPHIACDEPEIELYAIDADEDSYEEEAAFVACRISELLDGTHNVRDGDSFRPVKPEDIVILLRSPGSSGAKYAKALAGKGIRCNFGGSVDVLKTEEVQTLRAILQIIDNPLQDIPLITALSSRVFGFTSDELALMRSHCSSGNFYHTVCTANDQKTTEFLRILKKLRNKAKLSTLPQLIQEIFYETDIDSIYAAMPDGRMRTENLQTFCQLVSGFDAGGVKSLDRFLVHLQGLDEKGVTGAGEDCSAGAVTVMSIHKSKGLEFPVVFLCGLSRKFNREDAYEQVLCDKKLGLGLHCVDTVNRVRYPSVAKRAIAAKILAESLSEELRVLYVAMTRPKDRLIMTYAAKKLPDVLSQIIYRMDISGSLLMTSDVSCPGKWILWTALQRSEAGAFFKEAQAYPEKRDVSKRPWLIDVRKGTDDSEIVAEADVVVKEKLSEDTIERMQKALSFRYSYADATHIPSKQTATQLKGRMKDNEVAQDAETKKQHYRSWRKPSFVSRTVSGTDYGNAVHSAMQYIRYEECVDRAGVECEISRLLHEGFISDAEAAMIDVDSIRLFFETSIGQKLVAGTEVKREFKFSVLESASKFGLGATQENVLLQGVVDCAIIEADGITVLDFKSDTVTDVTVHEKVEYYREQVRIYADALERIYKKPIKDIYLYFFSANKLVKL